MSDELDNNVNQPPENEPQGSHSTGGAADQPQSHGEPTQAQSVGLTDEGAHDDSAEPTDSIVRVPAFSDNDDAAPLEEIPQSPDDNKPVPTGDRHWYILKVQVNREDAIRDALQRKVAIAGLQDFFGELVVPDEKRTEIKNGKKKVVRVKLYPGYLIVNMELNEDTWFLVRETAGIGDFTGSGGKPSPMSPSDVAKIIKKQEEKTDEAPKINIRFKSGDRVRINDGMFANFEGSVETVDATNGRVTVMINIFGRSTPVELEYWQVESL